MGFGQQQDETRWARELRDQSLNQVSSMGFEGSGECTQVGAGVWGLGAWDQVGMGV